MDTGSNLSAFFQDRVERGTTVNGIVLVEVTGTFLGEYSATINVFHDDTRCIEMNMEANTGTADRKKSKYSCLT